MDFYSDVHATTLKVIDQIKGLPDFVKNADIVDRNTIPDEHFTYQEKRAYPAFDPASTYLSFAYSVLNKAPDHVREALVKKACFMGIEDDIKDFVAKYAYAKMKIQKEEAEKSFALPEKKAYPLNTQDQVFMAQEFFDKNAEKLSIPERFIVAKQIVKKANDMGVHIYSTEVRKYNHSNWLTREDKASSLIGTRAYFVQDDMAKMAYLRVAKTLEGNAEKVEVMMKLAEVVEKLDKHSGVAKKYGKGVVDPISTIFNTSIKQANEILSLVRLGDDSYPVQDLLEIPQDQYEEALGEEFLSEIQNANGELDENKIMDIIPTLPMSEKNVLKRFIDQNIASKDSGYEY